ncbi:hypothetical protein GCM10008957_25030 [Deinococcus ruber]|uniref:Knr4/Smi1-like domain-containing protein n=1 Tax=Deinococcus ruber TaxID=1848197 RepID=A0A918C809_9DEIO|nr:hypothetical protein GCM10008957_25030 [Deinococcus ruber]
MRDLAEETPVTRPLPTAADIEAAERVLDVMFPLSYRAFLLELSNVSVGTYEPLIPNIGWRFLDLLTNVMELRRTGLPTTLIPFVVNNGDAFCFDVESGGPEYAVVLWAHDGPSVIPRCPDFLSWIEQEWISPTAWIREDEW